LTLQRGETVGLVGESGCGKSTLARLGALLYTADSGQVLLDGQDVTHLPQRRLREFRRRVQLVFQDPFAALNPRLPISAILAEPLTVHRWGSKQQRRDRAAELLNAVGMPAIALDRYPHEFSGGQRQRIAIARALMLEPELIIADESVSALDVSVQSQILNLMADIKAERGLSYLFIGHDLAVVEHLADRVAVMYLGRIVEFAPRDELFAMPEHPYTRALIAAIPAIQAGGKRRFDAPIGDVPSLLNPPPGCPYHTRCPKAQALCLQQRPELQAAPGRPVEHRVACHFPESTVC
jgi:oligopeptide/dipeptide ABC transporter ATP-binding protein